LGLDLDFVFLALEEEEEEAQAPSQVRQVNSHGLEVGEIQWAVASSLKSMTQAWKRRSKSFDM